MRQTATSEVGRPGAVDADLKGELSVVAIKSKLGAEEISRNFAALIDLDRSDYRYKLASAILGEPSLDFSRTYPLIRFSAEEGNCTLVMTQAGVKVELPTPDGRYTDEPVLRELRRSDFRSGEIIVHQVTCAVEKLIWGRLEDFHQSVLERCKREGWID